MLIKKHEIQARYGVNIESIYNRNWSFAITAQLSEYDKSIGIKEVMLYIRIPIDTYINPKLAQLPTFACAHLSAMEKDDETVEFITFYFNKLEKVESEPL